MATWVTAALGGLSALGGLFGSKKTTTDSTNTITPKLTPGQTGLQNNVIGGWNQLLNGSGDGSFQDAYTTGGLKNINTSQNNAQQAIMDMLTARGLGRTSAGAGTLGDVSLSGASQTANFLNSVPMIMDARRQAILAGSGGFSNAMPVGQTQNLHSVSTGPAPTSPLAGAISGLSQGLATGLGQYNAQQSFADMLKQMYPATTFGTTTNGGSSKTN